MAIPLSYNFRNLVVRRTTTLMTALGIGLTVAVLLAILALLHGLRSSFESTGDAKNVLVTRKGSDSEVTSNFPRTAFQDLKFNAGIARGQDGEPLASLEMVTIISLASVDQPDGINVNVRGLTPAGLMVRPGLKLASGRWFQPGQREVTVGKHIAERHPEAREGATIHFGRGDWLVVGVLDAGRSAYNSEVYCDLNQVSADYNRTAVLSSALVQATDEVAVAALINSLNDDTRLNVSARAERAYYAAQTSTAAPIRYLGFFVSGIMAIGSAFAAMNTMYAAVARRAREIGTLRVLGFSRGSILLSFLVESLILSLAGGAAGCLMVLPLNGLTTGLFNFSTFSQTAFDFRISLEIIASGLVFASVLGALGGLLPARMAAKKEILTSLREW